MRGLVRTVAVVIASVFLPTAVFAQAGIAGSVKDASGAVLPGVTVEASSPALIEKTRSVVTDATGQYKITDLRPGTYTVTFTLAGFSTFKREGIEISGTFVANVSADLRVGAIEETITVTGETPVVDVQTVKTQQTLSADVISALPTARNYQNLHVLVPGVTVAAGSQDVGGAAGDAQIYFYAHGGNPLDSRTQVNGLFIGDPAQGGGRTLFVPSVGTAQETNITTSGGLGEAETAGIVVNIITKDGGNTFKGTIYGTGATEGMISNNYDQALQDAGLRAPNNAKNNYDFEGALGGPVLKDKLWFFGESRYHGNTNFIAGMFPNKNAGDITKWTYDPDLTTQALQHSYWPSASLRLTWQATSRNKFVVSYEDQLRCASCPGGGSKTGSGTATSAPEGSGNGLIGHPNNVGQFTWTSPLSNRVLLEAGLGLRQLRFGTESVPDLQGRNDLIRVTAQNGSIPGLAYRACACGGKTGFFTYASRASVTYTSGAHSMKFGYNGTLYSQARVTNIMPGDGLQFRFTTPDPGGVPNQITENITPLFYQVYVNTGGLYAQDQWTRNRLTLAGGVRYDFLTTQFPAAQVGPTRFAPTPLVFPDSDYVSTQDITPRMSAAYDLFGNGKTALKVSLGKYLVAQDGGSSRLGAITAPVARIATSTSRAWTDSNRNFVPDCNLSNPAAQNLSATGGDVCGALANSTFGTAAFSTNYDPAILKGWGVRQYDWNFDVAVQRELVPRVSVNIAYFRRWFGNFLVTQNRAVPARDYTFFNVPVSDPRLPVSGAVTGFFDVNPAPGACGNANGCFGLVDNYVTAASNFGNETQHWNGMDISVNARLRDVLLQGGVSTGRESRDLCEVAAKEPNALLTANVFNAAGGISIQELSIPMQYCHVDGTLVTQIKMLGSYTVPRIDVQLAGTLQNIPGQEIFATYAAPNAVVAPLLGRNLAGGSATTTLQLLPPITYYSDRTTQIDFRAAKILRFAGKRAQVSVDLYNALNSNTVQTFNPAYTPTGSWRIPTAILPARVVKLTGQFDF